jgi:AraC family transcriptional regulator, regulatory protein of adaptative response / DNA-3-methyladenine glycosylase II
MELDREACYRAICARDARFDGRFFVAVCTTRIFCRPICPARTPRFENVEFYRSAAAAYEAGFRPCLRCRPECSPELAGVRGTSRTVSRALALIAAGALDGDAGVEELAARLGLGERQLRRLFMTHLGASPLAVAQTRRLLLAKQLLHDTQMTMSEVSAAAGFGSLRRFNDTFQRMYGRPPSSLRRARSSVHVAQRGIALALAYAPPYDWHGMLAFFAARAIEGVERVDGERYQRTIALGGEHGTVSVSQRSGRSALLATIVFPDVRALPLIIARLRRQFDLGNDVAAIHAQLAADPLLARLVAERPGLRIPGAWDPFELAVRAVLGQQITVGAARKLAGKLVRAYGEPLACEAGAGLERVFPDPARVAHADSAVLGMPRARARTLRSLAAAALADARLLLPEGELADKIARLRALPGVGEWTAQYIALRALQEPDAFPASDIGLLRAIARSGEARPTAAALLERAEAWRPWRAHAAQHLWSFDAAAGDARAASEAVA